MTVAEEPTNLGEPKITADLAAADLPYTIGFEVRGTKTYFFSRFDVEEFMQKEASAKGSRIRKEHNPEWRVWRDDASKLACEGLQFHKALVECGRLLSDPTKSGLKSAKTLVQKALVPHEELCSFGVKTWDMIDVRPGRLKNGAVVPVERPVLKAGWKTKIHIDCVLPELFSPADVARLMTLAGQVAGIGGATTIGYGRFVVSNIEAPCELKW